MYHLSVFLHLFGAMIWTGGIFFLVLVVVPVARKLPPHERAALITTVASRFRIVGYSSLALVIVTGLVNLGYRGVTWESVVTGTLWQSTFGQLVVAKVALVLVMLLVSVTHDFVVGPASTRAQANAGEQPTPEVQRELAALRRKAAWLARLTGVLVLAVVITAVLLVRGLPW